MGVIRKYYTDEFKQEAVKPEILAKSSIFLANSYRTMPSLGQGTPL